MAMEVSVIRVPDGLPRWDLVTKYLRLRKEVFIDRLDWPLYEIEGMEFEQYDTVNAVYVIAHSGSDVLGGARLLRTTQKVGMGRITYSYMIRDACRNILPGLPSDLCADEPPSDPLIWELTRLATLSGPKITSVILKKTNAFLKSEGARACLFLASPTFMRLAENLGFLPIALGPVKENKDGKFLAFRCDVI